ncbi:MAG: D-aminoacyl-tRNA deacylase [Bacillota bacterium]|nr:D-aminoacyl-tRNA deacylase [Bacillota bacterium]HHU62557.1 D-tyrosyl-tRNA(Tyr) deacylase [Natronincola sp.]
MRAVVQRVKWASVLVEENTVADIGKGLLVLLGVGEEDTAEDAHYLANKIAHLRIFSDHEDKMNLSVQDIGGSILAVSQFTLYGDCRKGRRPSFSSAAPPKLADLLYEEFINTVEKLGVEVKAGVFQAHMEVTLLNDGPVTMLLSSEGEF